MNLPARSSTFLTYGSYARLNALMGHIFHVGLTFLVVVPALFFMGRLQYGAVGSKSEGSFFIGNDPTPVWGVVDLLQNQIRGGSLEK